MRRLPNSAAGGSARSASEAGAGSRGLTAPRPLVSTFRALYSLIVDLECGHRARPAAIDREMRQNAGGFARLDTVGEGSTQVAGQLGRSSGRDQHRDGHQAAIAWRQLGPRPHVTEEYIVGEGRQAGRDPLLEFSRRLGVACWRLEGGGGLLGNGPLVPGGCGSGCGAATTRRYIVRRSLFPSIALPYRRAVR